MTSAQAILAVDRAREAMCRGTVRTAHLARPISPRPARIQTVPSVRKDHREPLLLEPLAKGVFGRVFA